MLLFGQHRAFCYPIWALIGLSLIPKQKLYNIATNLDHELVVYIVRACACLKEGNTTVRNLLDLCPKTDFASCDKFK